jgi:hypothetical protein
VTVDRIKINRKTAAPRSTTDSRRSNEVPLPSLGDTPIVEDTRGKRKNTQYDSFRRSGCYYDSSNKR